MKVMNPAGWAGVLCVSLGVALGASAPMQDPPEVLTKSIRKKLDKQFSAWSLAAAPACPGAASSATADIDFDQNLDTGLVVTTHGGEARVVIVLPRVIGDAVVHDLGPLSAVPGATHLVVLPLGTVVREAGAMFDDYLSGPTFAAASCEKALVAYSWTGYGFRARTLK
jgi:hypothetical protein